ncbi:MAG: metal-dependent hydrolase [Bacteroidetes bacterium]|nr:metal-dependent hydrolase [Bacteroidota bacterium]
MKLTYLGHASFLAEVTGKNLLFDPFISPNELARSIHTDKINADYILISHGHEDHLADAASIAKRTGATIISNFEIVTWFSKNGIPKGHPMNYGGTWSFDFGKVKMVNAVHSSTLPDGSSGGNPCGFIIRHHKDNFYFSGDTALHFDMKLMGEHDKITLAALCIGDNFTMGVDDAVIASDFIGCSKIIGMHYDTFGYIKIDHTAAKSAFRKAGKELFLMNIGETAEF